MGGNLSATPKHLEVQVNIQDKIDQIVQFVMPVFYTRIPFTEEESQEIARVWRMMMNNKSNHFHKVKADALAKGQDFPHEMCSDYFNYIFYTRLFDVHPDCRPLFKKPLNKQGSFFLRYFQMLVKDLQEDEQKFVKSLEHLAFTHNKYGIQGMEYGIAGEVFLYSIRACIGDAEYTPVVHSGWAKFYSRLLDVIIPAVVTFEIKNKEEAESIRIHRFKEYEQSLLNTQKAAESGSCPHLSQAASRDASPRATPAGECPVKH